VQMTYCFIWLERRELWNALLSGFGRAISGLHSICDVAQR
jgi:hypothetical protein